MQIPARCCVSVTGRWLLTMGKALRILRRAAKRYQVRDRAELPNLQIVATGRRLASELDHLGNVQEVHGQQGKRQIWALI